jgi:alpha-glucosidase
MFINRIMMTESYSPAEIIKKYYQSEDGSLDGSHLPFNFQMINKIKSNSTAEDFVGMVTDWFEVIPKGKVTNWVVSH